MLRCGMSVQCEGLAQLDAQNMLLSQEGDPVGLGR